MGVSSTPRKTAAALAAALLAAAPAAASEEGFAPEIVVQRGVDEGVDYDALARFGPWDDRNYLLTSEDLELLAPDEAQLHDAVPAFFRVLMRRQWPELPKEGPAQYPRSAAQIFRNMCGGLLYQSRIYTQGTRTEEGWLLLGEGEEAGADPYPKCGLEAAPDP